MKIVRVQDIMGTEREVTGPGWTSRRMLLKKTVWVSRSTRPSSLRAPS